MNVIILLLSLLFYKLVPIFWQKAEHKRPGEKEQYFINVVKVSFIDNPAV